MLKRLDGNKFSEGWKHAKAQGAGFEGYWTMSTERSQHSSNSSCRVNIYGHNNPLVSMGSRENLSLLSPYQIPDHRTKENGCCFKPLIFGMV